ncbi:hypothetical protein DRH27_05285 [Candidatus Falkowbacteria bacterium]|nr:MAG: hypothetical protein DRH27_05285 [Candidatus Falkowbacteria bacterium]
MGLIDHIEEDYVHNISLCYRCDTQIEPIPSEQWFINVSKKLKVKSKKNNINWSGKSIKDIALEVVKSGKIKILPERFEKNYYHWMENLRDWCISRQIWYGHRVPVWYREQENKKTRKQENKKEIYVGVEAPEGKGWVQDGDTLDTWFSSGLWTFSTLASSPDQIRIKDGRLVIDSEDFKNFHPTQVLETGYDIIFFWVARMIIMTTYAVGDIPFEDVYLHGLVLDDKGKKMSKSKGNVINPLDMCEKYGTDATRLSLVVGSSPGKDLKLSEDKIAGFRNFSNKLWNIARYVIYITHKTQYTTDKKINYKNLTLADKFILGKLEELIKNVTSDLDNYRFSQAGEKLREFTWSDLADWYLEATKFQKGEKTQKVLIYVLRDLLKLWHPFIPFVTEAIWKEFNDTDLIIEKWPEHDNEKINKLMNDVGVFELLQNIIIAIRNARAENKVEPGKKIKAVIIAGEKEKLIKENGAIIKGIRTGVDELETLDKGEEIKDAIKLVVGEITIYLIGAIDKEKEKERIKKEIANTEKMISIIEKKLGNGDFIKKAPKEIVDKEKSRLKELKTELKELIV